jgi:hypothetical protein
MECGWSRTGRFLFGRSEVPLENALAATKFDSTGHILILCCTSHERGG